MKFGLISVGRAGSRPNRYEVVRRIHFTVVVRQLLTWTSRSTILYSVLKEYFEPHTRPYLSKCTQPQRDSVDKQVRAPVDQLCTVPVPGPSPQDLRFRRWELQRNPTRPFADLDVFDAHLRRLVPPGHHRRPSGHYGASQIASHYFLRDLPPRKSR